METKFKSLIFENNVIVKKYNKDFLSETMVEQQIHLDNELVKGEEQEIQLNGVFLAFKDIIILNDYLVEVSHDFPLFKLHFEIVGGIKYMPYNEQGMPIDIAEGYYNLIYIPKVKGKLSYAIRQRKTLEVKFTEVFLKKVLGDNFNDTLHDFGVAVTNNKPIVLWKNNKLITPSLQEKINEIIYCTYTGAIKKAFLEVKVMELLVVVLAQKSEVENVTNQVRKHEIDTILIIKVEKYIKKHLKNNLTIAELAKLVGLNSSKLKRDFKIVKNNTVFKYITKLRMEKARNLITKNKHTISQASYEVGYKNPQHFTVAFKKYYGYLPSSLNKF